MTFEINIKCLKIPTGGRQTTRPFTKRSQGVKLGTTENKSNSIQELIEQQWRDKITVTYDQQFQKGENINKRKETLKRDSGEGRN